MKLKNIIDPFITAPAGSIAKTVLLPGDPLRAAHIAKTFLTGVEQYDTRMELYGFTGLYDGVRVSVQSTGMGTASVVETILELYELHGCRNFIRIGTCATFSPAVRVGDTILSLAVGSESSITAADLGACDFVPSADFRLLATAYEVAAGQGVKCHVGATGCNDMKYYEDPWHGHGILGLEMEGTGLYATAARLKGARALMLLTCSDHRIHDEHTPLKDRESTYVDMMRIALETARRMEVDV